FPASATRPVSSSRSTEVPVQFHSFARRGKSPQSTNSVARTASPPRSPHSRLDDSGNSEPHTLPASPDTPACSKPRASSLLRPLPFSSIHEIAPPDPLPLSVRTPETSPQSAAPSAYRPCTLPLPIDRTLSSPAILSDTSGEPRCATKIPAVLPAHPPPPAPPNTPSPVQLSPFQLAHSLPSFATQNLLSPKLCTLHTKSKKSPGSTRALVKYNFFLTAHGKRLIADVSSNCSFGDFLLQRLHQFRQRTRTQIALRPMPQTHRSRFRFLRPNHQHVRNLLQLRVANLRRQFFVPVIEVHTQPVILQRLENMFRVIRNFLAHRTNLHLHWCEPQRKRARIVLDQNSKKTLDRSQQRAMHHQRLMPRPVFAHVLQAKSRRQIEIELHRRQLPRSSNRVNHLNVDFRAIKRPFACHFLIRNVQARH